MAHEPAPSGGGGGGGEKKGALAALSPGKLFVGFVTGIILIALVGGFAGCFSTLDLSDAIGGHLRTMASCSLAFSLFGLSVSGWFLGIFATFFDLSILGLVTNMGSFLGKQSAFAPGIEIGWKILRDLANFAFIIAMVWTAISIILNLGEGKANPTKTVVSILVAAVLVNFSYLFGAVIIDASNFVTHKIYQEGISSEEYTNPFARGGPWKGSWETLKQIEFEGPVTSRFMQVTGLQSFYDWRNVLNEDYENKSDKGEKTDAPPINALLTMLMGMFGIIFFSMAAGIFAVAAVFIVIRFVIVALLLMLSPFGILAFIGQKPFKDWGMAWWKELQAQALFPIVFVFMIALSLKFVETGVATIARGDATYYKLLTATGNGVGIYNNLHLLFVFGISIALLYYSLKMATDTATQKTFTPPSTAAAFQMASQLQKVVGQLNPMSWGRKAAQEIVGTAGQNFLGDARIGLLRLDQVPGALIRWFPFGDEVKKQEKRYSVRSSGMYKDLLDANAKLTKEINALDERIADTPDDDPEKAKLLADRKALYEKREKNKAEAKEIKNDITANEDKAYVARVVGRGRLTEEERAVLGAPAIVNVGNLPTAGDSAFARASAFESALVAGSYKDVVSAVQDMSTQELLNSFINRKQLQATLENGSKMADLARALKGSGYNSLIREFPPDLFGTGSDLINRLEAMVPHMSKTTYADLKGDPKLGPIHIELDNVVDRVKPGLKKYSP